MDDRTQIDIHEGMSGKINDQLVLGITHSLACIWFPAHQKSKRANIKLSSHIEKHESRTWWMILCVLDVFTFLWAMSEINVPCEQQFHFPEEV